ncbi:MAG: hypothetical protein KDB53_04305 [Planctomycetes bacterium]|nr:hypothetical protein [Planctomycetota bacterium]
MSHRPVPTRPPSGGGAHAVLFFMLMLCLAGLVHVGRGQPAEARLSRLERERDALDESVRQRESRIEEKKILRQALVSDAQTVEGFLRREGMSRANEIVVR